MDLVGGLAQLGLTEYEARAYAALLAGPGSTGYEVARQSGVPRARIYEVLEGLVAKGAALTSQVGERVLYHPVPHATLLRHHLEQAHQLADALGPALDELTRPEPEAPLVTVRSREALLDKLGDIAAAARTRLFLSGWPVDLEAVAPHLQAAELRGVRLFVLTYGEADLGLQKIYYHEPPSPQGRPLELVPSLVAVADHSECLLAEMAPGARATGLWTRNQGVALIAAEFIRHDIFLAELFRRLPPEVQQQVNALTADLQAMWFDTLL